jgi:hypothetical protein
MNNVMKVAFYLFPLLMLFSFFTSCCTSKKSWAVYYGKDASPETLSNYDIVVIDPVYPHEIDLIRKKGSKVFIYVSIGEVRNDQLDLYRKSEEAGLLLQENENWKGSYIVDIRNAEWIQLLQENVLVPLSKQDYDGFMLDTGDSPLSLENHYPGMKEALINICRTIRQNHPDKEVIINRSFEAFPEIGQYVDYVIFESMLTRYNFFTGEYEMRSAAEIEWLNQQYKTVKKSNSRIKMLALDYWPEDDQKSRKKIASKLRKLGFIPFISTIMLHDLSWKP